MSNSNFEPMPFRRKFGSDKGEGPSRTLSDLAGTASLPDPDSYVDASGLAIVKPIVTGACRKCGYPGHLPFQCRNYIKLKPNQDTTMIDVESTSSDSEPEETPLVAKKKSKSKKKHKKSEKKKRKKEKKSKKRRRRSSSSSSASSGSEDEKRKKRKRKREKVSSSSSDSDSDRDRKRKKKRRSPSYDS